MKVLLVLWVVLGLSVPAFAKIEYDCEPLENNGKTAELFSKSQFKISIEGAKVTLTEAKSEASYPLFLSETINEVKRFEGKGFTLSIDGKGMNAKVSLTKSIGGIEYTAVCTLTEAF